MSTEPLAAQVKQPTAAENVEIKIVSHSNLFYWWPLWAIGVVLGLLTVVQGHIMAIVPAHTEVVRGATVDAGSQKYENVDALVPVGGNGRLPEGTPHVKVASNKGYGVLYTVVLLLLIVITNVPLRGLWSLVVIVFIVMLTIILALAHLWGPILDALGELHIYINAAGYFLISGALFVIWLVTFVFFDPQIYMVFTPGQLRVRQEIGGGESAYDTAGMVIQKQRNDLFRHWILGLGSGDLIVTTSGATAHHFDLPNVLFVGYKVRQIEEMLREKPVVQG